MKRLIDLHIHTNFSDGVLSPKEVIDEAVKNDVSAIAIADHDTVEAYDEAFYAYAKKKEITVIPAVEISTKTEKTGIHILGYDLDVSNPELKQKLYSLRNARHEYLYRVASKLEQFGYIVNVEQLSQIDAVTKAHIALDVVQNPKNEHLLFKTFHKIPDKGTFIETMMNEGCPAYVINETITPKEAANFIRSAGGKVILAHPVSYTYEDNLTDEEILKIAKDIQVDGIEANYLYIDCNGNRINEMKKWNTIAKEHHFITTIGSDFHQHDGIHPEIGFINEPINFEKLNVEEIIDQLSH